MQFIEKHFKSLLYGAVFSVLTYFIHNPFYDSCTFGGCNYGEGFPLPFYFDKFCAPGDANCITGYFSGATFLFDLIFMMLVFVAIRRAYQFFLTEPDDTAGYKIRN